MQKRQANGRLYTLRLLLCLLFFLACAGQAGTLYAAKRTTGMSGPRSEWVAKDGYTYYMNKKGKVSKGLCKISGKYYLFDRKGRQQTGWRVIRDQYYFFRQKNGRKGWMVTSERVNGIWLRKSGKAKVTSQNRWKITLMARYQTLLDSIVTPGSKKTDKLKAAFNFAKHKTEDSFGILKRDQYGGNWYLHYAEFFLNNDRADCYTRGCGLAFLANAIGCKNVKCAAAMGHGFCEINDRVFDPSFAKPYSDTEFPYFNGSYKVYSAWAGYPYKVLL